MTFKVKLSALQRAGLADDFAVQVQAMAHELNMHAGHMAQVAQGKAQAYPGPDMHGLVREAIRHERGRDRADRYVVDFEIEDDVTPTPSAALKAKKAALTQAVLVQEREAVGAVLSHGKHRLYAATKADIDRTAVAETRLADVDTRIARTIRMLQAVEIRKTESEARFAAAGATITDAAATLKRPAKGSKIKRFFLGPDAEDEDEKRAAATAQAQAIEDKKISDAAIAHAETAIADSQARLEALQAERVRAAAALDAALAERGLAGTDPAKRKVDDAEFLRDFATRATAIHAIERHAAKLLAAVDDLTLETAGAWSPAPFPN